MVADSWCQNDNDAQRQQPRSLHWLHWTRWSLHCSHWLTMGRNSQFGCLGCHCCSWSCFVSWLSHTCWVQTTTLKPLQKNFRMFSSCHFVITSLLGLPVVTSAFHFWLLAVGLYWLLLSECLLIFDWKGCTMASLVCCKNCVPLKSTASLQVVISILKILKIRKFLFNVFLRTHLVVKRNIPRNLWTGLQLWVDC